MSYLGGASQNDYSEITLMSLSAIYDRDLSTNDGLMHLEKESSFSIEAVKRPTDLGKSRLLYYKFTARLIVPQNSYALYKWIFDRLRTSDWGDMWFIFSTRNKSTGVMNALAGSVQFDPNHSSVAAKALGMDVSEFLISSVDERLRLTITMSGLMAPTLFDAQQDLDDVFKNFTIT